MISNNENRWWNIFTPEKTSKKDDNCPALPMSAGRKWYKGLASLYCPCRSDSTATECQAVFL